MKSNNLRLLQNSRSYSSVGSPSSGHLPLLGISTVEKRFFNGLNLSAAIVAVIVCFCLPAQAADKDKGGTNMKLTSPAFAHNQVIPKKYTCQGEDINPPLVIENVPKGTKTLALIMDDPDAPMGTWVHWVVYDMPIISRIEENTIPGKQGSNDFRRKNYGGPCPPSGTHRYFFKLYALDTMLNLKEGISKKDLEKAIQGHILDKAELIGLYKKS